MCIRDSGWGFAAVMYLNYTSDIHADGDGVHNHTTHWNVCDANNSLTNTRELTAPNRVPSIPETNFFLNGVGYEVLMDNTGLGFFGISLSAEEASDELNGKGWAPMLSSEPRTDAERGVMWQFQDALEFFAQYPGDLNAGMDVEQSRAYRLNCGTTQTSGVMQWVTYHGITFDVAGNVTGSAGATVNLDVYRPGSEVVSTSRTGDGAFSAVWYDDTEALFVRGREDATHVGSSDDDNAA